MKAKMFAGNNFRKICGIFSVLWAKRYKALQHVQSTALFSVMSYLTGFYNKMIGLLQ